MRILVINAGSSSIKYQLFDMQQRSVLADGMVERIGEEQAVLKYEFSAGSEPVLKKLPIKNHAEAMQAIADILTDAQIGVIQNAGDVNAVGHRVVHGGEDFQDPVVINETVIAAIQKNSALAPLHNPANLTGIQAAQALFATTPQVAVFDTAFHQSLPRHAYHYAIPDEYYQKLRIRRYGFHGTSHLYVSKKAAELLGQKPEDTNLITIHLGNGCSMAAVQKGKSIDTSMGLTPLEGLIMGTRSGDIDPALPFFLADNSPLELHEIERLLNKESGLKGLAGTNDMRDILAQAEAGDAKARLSIDMYSYRIKKYIGAYYAALGQLDAIVFTAGIGENAALIRSKSCSDLERLGIMLDNERNLNGRLKSTQGWRISNQDSNIQILVVPTDEELEIAEQTLAIIQ